MKSCILLVDDDSAWRQSLTDTLVREGFGVLSAATGAEALRILNNQKVDLVIVDVQLPDIDGIAISREVRRRPGYLPIIMISGVHKADADLELGLLSGADHYFEKPTEPRVLIAQIRASLRMAAALRHPAGLDGWFEVDDYLRIHFGQARVVAGGRPVDLSHQEFAALAYLARNAGTACTRDDLIENIWGRHAQAGVSDAAINTLIARLRHKIEPDPRNPRYVLTVFGWGYKFRDL